MATSMRDYLKRYTSASSRSDDGGKGKGKGKAKVKKRKGKGGAGNLGNGVVIVDDDAGWKKEGNFEDEDDEPDEEADKPTVIEEVDVKAMQRMEMLKTYRPYLSVANDGSGWVTVNGDDDPEAQGRNQDMSPHSRSGRARSPVNVDKRRRNDSPDLSSPRRRNDSPDMSPPRSKRNDSPDMSPLGRGGKKSPGGLDKRRRNDTPETTSPRRQSISTDLSPPRRRNDVSRISPPRRGRDQSSGVAETKRRRNDSPEFSPPRRRKASPDRSPPRMGKGQSSGGFETINRNDSADLSPPRKRNMSPDISPPRRQKDQSSGGLGTTRREDSEDLSPPRKRKMSPHISASRRGDSLSGAASNRRRNTGDTEDLSPLRRKNGPGVSPPRRKISHDLSPPRRKRSPDLSPQRKSRFSSGPDVFTDSSPPRGRGDGSRKSNMSEEFFPRRGSAGQDLSPPRRRNDSPDLYPPRKTDGTDSRLSKFSASAPTRRDSPDLSPPRKRSAGRNEVEEALSRKMAVDGTDRSKKKSRMADGSGGGLRTDKEIGEEIQRKKASEAKVLEDLDPSLSGRGAETVYRDKRGRRLEGLEELLRQQKGEAKPVEQPLEWGKGLAQKKELAAKLAELEKEKSLPFARSRDDPEMDKELKERVRWGDPMAHLVKKKASEFVLTDFGSSEEMKASGFIVPQDIPSHSWLKRGIAPPANRYGIKPGRHWDGVDRSTGYERDMFKQKNEKQAMEREAYLWSVSDM